MRIAYLSYLTQADVDLSLMIELQHQADVDLYLYVNPKHIKKSVIKLGHLYPETGIFPSTIYPELQMYSKVLDLDRVRIINVAEGKLWQAKATALYSKLALKLAKEYDLVHITGLLQPPEWPLYCLGKRLILTVHDPIPHSCLETGILSKTLRHLAFNRADNFLILNQKQIDEFASLYHIDRARIYTSRLSKYTCLEYVDNKTDSSASMDGRTQITPGVKEEGHSSAKSRYALFAGRISPYKGLQYLMPAILKAHTQKPDLKFVIAGSGAFNFDITPYQGLDYIDIRNRFIPDDELVELIKHSKFMICPYTDATQSGVIMSAFAFNKPILATNVGALPEMVTDRRHGLIVKEKDIDALVQGIIEMDDQEFLDSCASNIQLDYEHGEYSWSQISKNLAETYRLITQRLSKKSK